MCKRVKTDPKYKDQMVQTETDTLHSVAASDEFSFVSAPSQAVNKSAKTNGKPGKHLNSRGTKQPVPKPRRRVNSRRMPLPEVDDVFESVEIDGKTNEQKPTECFFLSVATPEVLKETENLSRTPPFQCQKNFIPKNELSLLLPLSPELIKSKHENLSTPQRNQFSLLDVISKWLNGQKNEPLKVENNPSYKGKDAI